MSIYLIATDPGVGGNFLDWTCHWLAGNQEKFVIKIDHGTSRLDPAWLPVITDPIDKINSHRSKSTHPLTTQVIPGCCDLLTREHTGSFHTIYTHTLVDAENPFNPDPEPRRMAYGILADLADKSLIVFNDAQTVLYHCSYVTRGGANKIQSLIDWTVQTDAERWKEFIEAWFPDSVARMSGLDLPWEWREFLALNFRPLERYLDIAKEIEPGTDRFLINTTDFWCYFDHTVHHVLDFLEIRPAADKLQHWKNIYAQWRQVHRDRVLFARYFDQIIDCILHGHALDLTRFNLDIVQEAAIQHCLLYRHNLNLKNWQLDRFLHTKQLHDLLEPNNLHVLSKS